MTKTKKAAAISFRIVGPRPHLLITNNGAKMMAAMPQSWDQQDDGCEADQMRSGRLHCLMASIIPG